MHSYALCWCSSTSRMMTWLPRSHSRSGRRREHPLYRLVVDPVDAREARPDVVDDLPLLGPVVARDRLVGEQVDETIVAVAFVWIFTCLAPRAGAQLRTTAWFTCTLLLSMFAYLRALAFLTLIFLSVVLAIYSAASYDASVSAFLHLAFSRSCTQYIVPHPTTPASRQTRHAAFCFL